MRYDPDIRELLAIDIPAFMSAHDLGEFLGVGERQITALTKRGILEKNAKRKFDVRESTLAYLKHAKKTGNPDLDYEKVRTQRETADKLELANAEKRRELIPAGEVTSRWTSILATLRARLLSVPSRVAARGLTVETVDREIRDALEELSREP